MANSIKKARFYLPTDLIYHALLWLPIKTLIRFKSVCKAWSALIENPYFVEQYQILQSVRELDPICNYMLVNASSPAYAINLLYCNDASHKLIESDTSFFSDMKLASSSLVGMDFHVVGIDNGLVCLHSYIYREEIIISNPTTRQLCRIRPFELSKEYNSAIVFTGFVSLCNDYQLIRIVCSFMDRNSLVLRAELYTKGSNTLRDIEVKMEVSSWLWRLNKYKWINYSEAVLINGVFYWKPIYDGHDQFVSYFDIQKGVFDVIETPLETRPAWGYQLYGLKDRLALIAFKHLSESMWILNENLTWTEVKIDFSAISDYNAIFGSKISVLGSTRNDKLVLKRVCDGNLKLFLYDIDSQELKILHDVNYKGCIHNLYLYTPALTPVS